MQKPTTLAGLALFLCFVVACAQPPEPPRAGMAADDPARVRSEVEAAVWTFHAADVARDAEAVIQLLWPEFTMLVDGARMDYAQIASGSRTFMASVETFDTEWSDLQVTPLGPNHALASFMFRDSILTKAGESTRAQGPTTFVWERRAGEWRLLFADADHYPVEP